LTKRPVNDIALKAALRNKPSGSIGAFDLNSMARKSAASTAKLAKPVSANKSLQPRSPPSIIAAASDPSASTAVICPGMSSVRAANRAVSVA
jgi:hypothetical protein